MATGVDRLPLLATLDGQKPPPHSQQAMDESLARAGGGLLPHGCTASQLCQGAAYPSGTVCSWSHLFVTIRAHGVGTAWQGGETSRRYMGSPSSAAAGPWHSPVDPPANEENGEMHDQRRRSRSTNGCVSTKLLRWHTSALLGGVPGRLEDLRAPAQNSPYCTGEGSGRAAA
jgi:hypothetical protein